LIKIAKEKPISPFLISQTLWAAPQFYKQGADFIVKDQKCAEGKDPNCWEQLLAEKMVEY
jgi:hypothetical protein